jgi:hypothetical protein
MKYNLDIPVPSFLSLRLILIIYALAVLYRINGNKIQVFESIGVAIFPAFFLGYTATVSPEYINLFQPESTITGPKPDMGLIHELKNLKQNQKRTLMIFIPIYIIFTYKLNKNLINSVINYILKKTNTKPSGKLDKFIKKL